MVYVNAQKLERAKEIVGLCTGEITPRNSEEMQRVEHFSKIAKAKNIDLKGKDAVTAIYEVLGGLIRSDEEHKKAQAKAKEMREKGRKDKMGLKK